MDYILGSEKANLISTVGTTVLINESSVSYMFNLAASLIIGILSTQKNKENINASGLDELIQSVLGSSSKFDKSLVNSFSNHIKDGRIIDDVDEKIIQANKDKKGDSKLGSMLGGK